MWVICSLFFIISAVCVLARNSLLFKERESFMGQREVKLAFIDLVCHSLEITLGITFLNPGLVCKEMVGTMAIASSIVRLSKFGVK